MEVHVAEMHRFVGRSAVIPAACGQADSPGPDGVRDIDDDPSGPRFRDDWRVRQAQARVGSRRSRRRERPATWDPVRDALRRGWAWLTIPEDEQSSMREGP